VIDLGSGCGFIADALAPDVAHLWCADISKSFLDYAKKVTQKHANVTCQQIEFGKLSGLPQVTARYSVAVFIHFNLYDCYLYLTQCYNCLESNGRLREMSLRMALKIADLTKVSDTNWKALAVSTCMKNN
jgi:cyclopropane fatty-acyl-phospholipid synthase-like methyltransferase